MSSLIALSPNLNETSTDLVVASLNIPHGLRLGVHLDRHGVRVRVTVRERVNAHAAVRLDARRIDLDGARAEAALGKRHGCGFAVLVAESTASEGLAGVEGCEERVGVD